MTFQNYLDKTDILEFIQLVRDSFIGAEHVYMNGSCYYFAKLLQAVFDGELYDTIDHVYFVKDGKAYDIRGEVYWPDDVAITAAEPTKHGKFNLITFKRPACGGDVS